MSRKNDPMNNHIDFSALIAEYEQLAFRLSSKADDLREQAKIAPTHDERYELNNRADSLERISREKLKEAKEMRVFMREKGKEI